MALAPNDKPVSPSAIAQQNRDEQRREESENEPNVAPSRANNQDAPLFTHRSKITPVEHPFVQPPRGDMPQNEHPGQSPTQSPNDGGRSSGGAA